MATKDKTEDAEDNEQTLVVTAKVDGFRRAGREWSGVTEVPASEFTHRQIDQLLAEPKLHVQIKA